jgi:hypothetical protein
MSARDQEGARLHQGVVITQRSSVKLAIRSGDVLELFDTSAYSS